MAVIRSPGRDAVDQAWYPTLTVIVFKTMGRTSGRTSQPPKPVRTASSKVSRATATKPDPNQAAKAKPKPKASTKT